MEIEIRNFKSIVSTRLQLEPGVNILIGPNGSGKTCVLTAINFIRNTLLHGVARAMAITGGPKRVYHRNSEIIFFRISSSYGERTYNRKKRNCNLTWELAIAQRGPEKIATIIYEKIQIRALIKSRSKILFEFSINRENLNKPKTKIRFADINSIGKDFFSFIKLANPQKSKVGIFEDSRKFMARARKFARKKKDWSILFILSGTDYMLIRLLDHFRYLNEYNILPEVARDSTEQLPYAKMQPDGAGVSEVIHALSSKNYGKLASYRTDFDYGISADSWYSLYEHPSYRYYDFLERKRIRRRRFRRTSLTTVLESINELLTAAVHNITSVETKIDPTNGRRFIVFNSGDETFNPEEVSDGTIKWLCILISIYVPYSIVYLLEEPENFLHPWMQQKLVEIMREQAKIDGTIFILTSHSTTILNSAVPSEVLLTTLTKQGTKIRKIEQREDIEKVLEASDFRLGDLWVSGALGGVPGSE